MSEINFNRPISASTPFAGGVSEGQGKEKVEQGKTERQDGVQEISNGLAQLHAGGVHAGSGRVATPLPA